ncbi:hypothetical protein CDAR_477871 [Caerostris darwini]|uniref:Uncharacterized protein n=1 Tax=Caerostris darwini TaxID=1538125 RepID=A0AAV4PXU7_9ARAC|nr:hypothetical protein CDAR_477871 [Caerostris darwini]
MACLGKKKKLENHKMLKIQRTESGNSRGSRLNCRAGKTKSQLPSIPTPPPSYSSTPNLYLSDRLRVFPHLARHRGYRAMGWINHHFSISMRGASSGKALSVLLPPLITAMIDLRTLKPHFIRVEKNKGWILMMCSNALSTP